MEKVDATAPVWFRDRNEECEFFEMCDELRELAGKIYNLVDYMIKNQIPDAELAILNQQLDGMQQYYRALGARILRVLNTKIE